MSLTETSPNSSWGYSSKCLEVSFFWTVPWLTVTWERIKFFTSSSETLPDLCVPGTIDTSAPSSRANFLTLGLAEPLPPWETGEIRFFFLSSFGGIGVSILLFSLGSSFFISS